MATKPLVLHFFFSIGYLSNIFLIAEIEVILVFTILIPIPNVWQDSICGPADVRLGSVPLSGWHHLPTGPVSPSFWSRVLEEKLQSCHSLPPRISFHLCKYCVIFEGAIFSKKKKGLFEDIVFPSQLSPFIYFIFCFGNCILWM